MKIKNLLLFSLSFGIFNSSSANSKLYVAGQDITGKASEAVLYLKKYKDIKWSGVVVQTIKNENEICFQVIETEDTPQGKPSYKMLSNANSFIACQNKNLKSKEYNNRLVTFSGDIDSYYHSLKEGHDFPVIDIKKIKTWPRSLNKIDIPHSNDVVGFRDIGSVSVD